MSSHTKGRTAWWVFVAIGFAAGVLLSLLACWLIGKVGSLEVAGTGNGDLEHPTDSFTIRGDVEQFVAPGSRVPVNLAITNRYEQSLTVTDLRIHVDSVNAPQATASRPCTVDDFVSQVPADFDVHIAAGKTITLADQGLAQEDWPVVGMLDTQTNQDGCKGATLTLSYSGSGRLEK